MVKGIVTSIFLLGCFFSLTLSQKASYVQGLTFGAPIGPKADESDKGVLEAGHKLGFFLSKSLSKWVLRSGLFLEQKKGSYDAYVNEDTLFALEIPGQAPALFPTFYEGRVYGSFDNTYLTVPLLVGRDLGWNTTFLGLYTSYLLFGSHTGETDLVLGNNFSKIEDPFDDSQWLNKFDAGIQFGSEFNLIKGLNLGLFGSYGLTNLFKRGYPNVKERFGNLYVHAYLAIDLQPF